VEAYKVRDLLAAHGTGIATWPDWWGFKMESYDAIPQNAMLVKRAGVPVNMHSDSATTVQRLHIEAAKLLAWGMTEQEALETITLDPARLLGLEGRLGSLSPGKDADFVIFSAHPFDMYSLVQQTWIDGQKVYDRAEQGAPDGWF
jgi:imidazolonepropionase-like amidohydrolase